MKDEFVDIAAQIGTDYELFGTFLLDDKNGYKVVNIEKAKRGEPLDITVEILRQWLRGIGRKPVTWQTLVKFLRDMRMHVLAEEIEHSISIHSVTMDSNHLLSDLPQEGRKNVQQ